MIGKSLASRLFYCFAVIMILAGISATAYSQGNSVLEVVPKGTLVCLRFTNLWEFDEKLVDLLDSLNIPDTSDVSIGPLVGKLVGAGIESLMDLEEVGFGLDSDIYIFWKKLSPDKFSLAIHAKSVEQAKEAVTSQMSGAEEQHRGVTYVTSDAPFAWVFLGDTFVYSKDKEMVMEAINTYRKESPSILYDDKYMESVKPLRTGDIGVYVALDDIATTFMPLLKAQAEKAKKELSKQMKQQGANMPEAAMDPTKILNAEIDMGLWLLQELRSCAISLGIGRDGVWAHYSVKFKPDSPVCQYLNIRPSGLKLVELVPNDVMMAGGATLDVDSIEKLNTAMMDLFLPVMMEKATERQIAELQEKYKVLTRDILSCFGDEVAFAINTKSDRMMPRVVYIFEVVDRAKAEETIGNLDYIMEMSKPFYQAFGTDVPMTKGPNQRHTGIQIESFQMDLSKMAELVPNGKAVYPDKEFLWYAFVDDKMVYAMSQSANTIKAAIDAVKGRKASMVNAPGFEDISLRLPQRSNAVLYISPAGYMNFVMNMMMSQMGQSMPPGSAGAIEPSMGFAIAVNLDGDGFRCFNYFLTKEIQELVSTVAGFSQMMNPQQ